VRLLIVSFWRLFAGPSCKEGGRGRGEEGRQEGMLNSKESLVLTSFAKRKKSQVKYFGPLPLGSWMILGNCVIYGFSSRFDKVAITAGTF
jgi:hypothetical protein